MNLSLPEEIKRRRTFAIISHPDAGKTTLSEKLLLYGQAIQKAGIVTQKTNRSHTVSDWMGIEQERGISISSSALQFDWNGVRYNLLDTPGHGDFSEDTYRTLMAVDSAIMLIDSVKGVEPQTVKLFKVCRERGIPIFTFINKMDRPGKNPFDLLEEVEEVLGILAVPMTWPIGEPGAFKGVYDRETGQSMLYQRTAGGQWQAPVACGSLQSEEMKSLMTPSDYERINEDMELVEGVLHPFEQDSFLEGELTPVFFGCAINNFGIDHFLENFTKLAPPPAPLKTTSETISPERSDFAGFVYKVQANMNPNHRDRMAFIRVSTGIFEKNMTVRHERTGKKIKLSYSYRLFGQKREIIETAFPGDIVGLVNPGIFKVGDLLLTGKPFRLPAFPRFAPELFVRVYLRDQSQNKSFRKGIQQLGEEGVVQIFSDHKKTGNTPVLAAVGQLQLEVFKERMETEYRCECRFETLEFSFSRWLSTEVEDESRFSFKIMRDELDRPIALFRNEWHMNQCISNADDLRFLAHPPD